jgi:uncharacterized protein YbaR (Trm112 family)
VTERFAESLSEYGEAMTPPSAIEAVPREPRRHGARAQERRRKRLLVVDDALEVRESICVLFEATYDVIADRSRHPQLREYADLLRLRRVDHDDDQRAADVPDTPWAELLRRTFKIDVLACPDCGGRLRLLATIEEPAVVRKILSHLGITNECPQPLPARSPPCAEPTFPQVFYSQDD